MSKALYCLLVSQGAYNSSQIRKPSYIVSHAALQYEELVEAGSVTTYDNTTIYFSYNEYEEVLGEWQDKTQAKAYVDYAVYPYGKVSRW